MTSSTVMEQSFTIEGTGLVTGLPVKTTISKGQPGQGVLFHIDGLDSGVTIPARLEAIVNTQRGVTLGHPSGKYLCIVEHFLAGCAMSGHSDLNVVVEGAPELPVLDGSAAQWKEPLHKHFGNTVSQPLWNLKEAVFYRHNDMTCVYAVPAESFKASYAVNFNHPGLQNRWVSWNLQEDGVEALAQARTFGYVRELPALQEQGLAKGVTEDNTLGLTDEGGYTRPLRFDDEPVYHKLLDLIGDLSLLGLNPLTINMHVYAINAGHASHTEFAKRLRNVLVS